MLLCVICQLKTNSSELNNFKETKAKNIVKEDLSYGLLPVHLLIHAVECFFHTAYCMKIKMDGGRCQKENIVIQENI